MGRPCTDERENSVEEEGPGSRLEQEGRLEGRGVIETGGTGVRCFGYAQEEEPARDLFPNVQKESRETVGGQEKE